MKKQSIGFALELMGIIFAVIFGQTDGWYIGVLFGLVGLVLVCISKKKEHH